jgi:ATP-dependent DNA helicase DinG
VVAVLDQRLATARYGSYLKASLPDFWYTTDRNQVRRSLTAIDATARKAEETVGAGETEEA